LTATLQAAQQLSDAVQAPSHAGAAAAVFALHCLHELQAAPQGGAAAGGGPRVRAYLPLPALRAAVRLLAELRRDGPPAAETGVKLPDAAALGLRQQVLTRYGAARLRLLVRKQSRRFDSAATDSAAPFVRCRRCGGAGGDASRRRLRGRRPEPACQRLSSLRKGGEGKAPGGGCGCHRRAGAHARSQIFPELYFRGELCCVDFVSCS
jgi:hypothetical protein